MTNNDLIINTDTIKSKIYTIRGLQVMLDKDLAELYEVKTIRLREQMKRNRKRFPVDFMFQLTVAEVESLLSQNAIPSKKYFGSISLMPLQNKGWQIFQVCLRMIKL